jgi:hypothetical protein
MKTTLPDQQEKGQLGKEVSSLNYRVVVPLVPKLITGPYRVQLLSAFSDFVI